jgi:hypothetical protein
MKRTAWTYLLLLIISAATGVAVWGALRLTAPRLLHYRESAPPAVETFEDEIDSARWAQAVERVKEVRADPSPAALEVPAELRHYEDRHWFLATQVAEVKEHNVQTCQDFLDVAAMISRGELVRVPAVTDDYVLFGVGAKADDSAFTRFQDDHTVPLYDEIELRAEYQRLLDERSRIETESARLKSQIAPSKVRKGGGNRELQKQISANEQQLSELDEEKKELDEVYGRPGRRDAMFRDYETLQTLAKDFRGRSYDLSNASQRQGFKIGMLSSLRPAALKVLEDVAAAYHRQFSRPLPVSSLVRPEEYQHVLRRYNRAATTIDTPPHSTGLAFDIDYRFMTPAEQNFVMNELAELKRAGRIEVLRERAANFHVFAFINGARPSDQLVAASLDEVGGPAPEDTKPAAEKPAKSKAQHPKSKRGKPTHGKSKSRQRRR